MVEEAKGEGGIGSRGMMVVVEVEDGSMVVNGWRWRWRVRWQ